MGSGGLTALGCALREQRIFRKAMKLVVAFRGVA
jgi:hypothetical protein